MTRPKPGSEDYVCEICDKRLSDRAGLAQHIQLHSSDKPFSCHLCPYICKTRKYLTAHTRKVHKKATGNECEVCGKKFHFKSLLEKHMYVHTNERPYKCEVCGKGFNSGYSLSTHRHIHSGAKPFKCQFCSYACRDSSTLRKHRERHMGIERLYQCKACDKSYKTKRVLKVHVAEAHMDLDVKTKPCDECGKMFASLKSLNNHVRILHRRLYTCKCDICGLTLACKYNMRAHLNTHIDYRPYKCGFEGCTKRFKDKGALKKHTIIHYPDKHFACDICEKRFSRAHRLIAHKKQHQAKRKCVFCDYCGKGFYNKNYIRSHIIRKHLNREYYICDICGLRTYNKPSIVMHLKYGHVNDADRQCKICKKRYKKHIYLKLHYWNTHCIKYKMNRHTLRKPKKRTNCIVEESPDFKEIELLHEIKVEPLSDLEQDVKDSAEYSRNEDEGIVNEVVEPETKRFEDFLIKHIITPSASTNDEEAPKQDADVDIDIKSQKEAERVKRVLLKQWRRKVEMRVNKKVRRLRDGEIENGDLEGVKNEQFEVAALSGISNVLINEPKTLRKKLKTSKSHNIEKLNDTKDSEVENQSPQIDEEINDNVQRDDNVSPKTDIVINKLEIINNLNQENVLTLTETHKNISNNAKEEITVTNNESDLQTNEIHIENNSQKIIEKYTSKATKRKYIKNDNKEFNETDKLSIENDNNLEENKRKEIHKPTDSTENNKEGKRKKKPRKRKYTKNMKNPNKTNTDSINKLVLTENDETNSTKTVENKTKNSIERCANYENSVEELEATKNDVNLEINSVNTENITNPRQRRARNAKKIIDSDSESHDDDDDYVPDDVIHDDETDDETNSTPGKFTINTHQCYVCFKLYETNEKLLDHCKEHFDVCNTKMLKKCPLCDYVTKSDLRRHIRLMHKINVNILYGTLKDRKNNNTKSRFYFNVENNKLDEIEVIPSIKNLNRQAFLKIDKERRENNDKGLKKTKLVKKHGEWIVEKETINTKTEKYVLPETVDKDLLKDNKDDYAGRMKRLYKIAKKNGQKMLFPCEKCEKICQTMSALKLHMRRHDPNAKPFKKKIWKHKLTEEELDKLSKKEEVKPSDNRYAKPKPIVNKHKCDPKLKDFYENNIKGGDIEFWQFLKIFNKMTRENVNDFADLEKRPEFGIHYYNPEENLPKENIPEANNSKVRKKTVVNKIRKFKYSFKRTIMISRKLYNRRKIIMDVLRKSNCQENIIPKNMDL